MADRTYGVNQSAMLRIGIQIDRNEAQLKRFMGDIAGVQKVLGKDLPDAIAKGVKEADKMRNKLLKDLDFSTGKKGVDQLVKSLKTLEDQAKKGFATPQEKDRYLAMATALKEIAKQYGEVSKAATASSNKVIAAAQAQANAVSSQNRAMANSTRQALASLSPFRSDASYRQQSIAKAMAEAYPLNARLNRNNAPFQSAMDRGAAGVRAGEERFASQYSGLISPSQLSVNDQNRSTAQRLMETEMMRRQEALAQQMMRGRGFISPAQMQKNDFGMVKARQEMSRWFDEQTFRKGDELLKKTKGSLEDIRLEISRVRNAFLLFNFAIRPAAAFVAEGITKYAQFQSAELGASRMGARAGWSSDTTSGMIKQLTGGGQMNTGEANSTIRTLASTGLNPGTIKSMLEAMKNFAAFSRNPNYSFAESIVTMAQGFKELNPRVLDNAGYLKNVEVALKQEAAAMGVSVDKLTERQKWQMVANRLIKDAAEVQGDYNAMLGQADSKINALSSSWSKFLAAGGGLLYNLGAGQVMTIASGQMNSISSGESMLAWTPRKMMSAMPAGDPSRTGMLGAFGRLDAYFNSEMQQGTKNKALDFIQNMLNSTKDKSIFGNGIFNQPLSPEKMAANTAMSEALGFLDKASNRTIQDDLERNLAEERTFWEDTRKRLLSSMVPGNTDADTRLLNQRVDELSKKGEARIRAEEKERTDKEGKALKDREARAAKARGEKRARMMIDIMEDELRIMNSRLDEFRAKYATRRGYGSSDLTSGMPKKLREFYLNRQIATERAQIVSDFTDKTTKTTFGKNGIHETDVYSMDPEGGNFLNQFDKNAEQRRRDLDGTNGALRQSAAITEDWAGAFRDVNRAMSLMGDAGIGKLRGFVRHSMVAVDALSNVAGALMSINNAKNGPGGFSSLAGAAGLLSGGAGLAAAGVGIYLAVKGDSDQKKANRQRGAEFGATVQRGPQVVNITPVLTVQADGNVIFSADGMEAVEADLVRRVQQAIDDGELNLASL